jgi:hypothetical protein
MKPKYAYRYEITEVSGPDAGVSVGSVIQDHRYQGRSHEWLIYNLRDMTLTASFKGKLIERIPVHMDA